MTDSPNQSFAEVCEASEADPRRAMHTLLLLRCPGQPSRFYEAGDWAPSSPIDDVLGAAGFNGSSPSRPDAVSCTESEVSVTVLRGFYIPMSAAGAAEAAIRSALKGDLGGFSGVFHQQSGFHNVIGAFDSVWRKLGGPPIHVYQANLPTTDAGSLPDAIESLSRLHARRRMDLRGKGYKVE
jgi:hypothetical protein